MAVVVTTVKVEVADPLAAGVTDAGDKLQVTVAFTGEIAQLKATVELKLFKDVTVIVAVVLFPAAVTAETGNAVMLKSLTVSA